MKLFVKKDTHGKIVAVSKDQENSNWILASDEDPQVQNFLETLKSESLQSLADTDQAMSRVLEDLVILLVDQGTIRFTDLPFAAQQKLLSRREIRGQVRGMDLLDDGDDLNI